MSTYDSNIPGVAQYGQAALIAKTAYQKALARINKQRGDVLRQYGFAGDINPESGVVGNVRVDPTNQYGALQMANRSQAMRDEQARWVGVDRGLGSGGGLAAQLRERTRFDFGREDAEIGTGLTNALAGFQDEQSQAGLARDTALYQAELEAARLAIQNEDFSPTDYSDVEIPVYGSPPATAAAPGIPRLVRPGVVAGRPTGYAPGGVTYKTPVKKPAAKPAPAKKPLLPQTKTVFKPVTAKKKKK